MSKIIVFDLDETLVHATKKRLAIEADFMYENYYVYKRPFVDEFLLACSKFCSIAIWSSADDDYVRSIVSELTDVDFEFVWGRSECWLKVIKKIDENTGLKEKEYQNIKPLEKIRRKGFKMSDLIIIDDSLYKVRDNPENYLIISPFSGDQKDSKLTVLLSFLKQLIEKGDSTLEVNQRWNNFDEVGNQIS